MSTSTPSSATRATRLAQYLALDPDNVQLLRDHAQEAVSSGDLPAALSSLERLCASADSQAADAGLQIAVLRAAGRLQDALDASAQALERWAGDQTVLVERANTLLLARQFEPILALVKTAGERGPDTEAAALEVRALHHLGQIEDAEQRIDALMAQGPAGPALMAAAIPVLLDRFRAREAAAMARQLTEHTAYAYPAWEALASEALEHEQPQESLAFVDRALATRQDDGRIWLLGGLAHWQAQNTAEAQQALERAASLMPEHAGTWLAVGWMQLLQGHLAQAKPPFDRALQASPDFSECHGSLAVLAALEGRIADAETLERKARRLDPACGSASLARALMQGLGQQELAEMGRRFVAGLRTDPQRNR